LLALGAKRKAALIRILNVTKDCPQTSIHPIPGASSPRA
jgi:hypothetical protein